MPPKKKKETKKETLDEQHKSVSEVGQQPRTETTSEATATEATVKSTEIKKDEVKHIHNAITFPCPACNICLQMSNQIEVNRKHGCKCKCVPFNFWISSSTQTLSINKKDGGDIELETDDHELKLSWSWEITLEDEKHCQEVSKIVKECMKNRFKE